MARVIYGNVDLAGNQILNVRLQVLPTAPAAPSEGQIYYNSAIDAIQYYVLEPAPGWVTLGAVGAGSPPTGAASGDLSGSYPAPQIAAGVIVDADVNASAAIAQTKIAGLSTSLSAKADATVQIVAGAGLAGGGTLAANRTLDVGAGTGITVSADAIAADLTVLQARSEKAAANGYAPLDASSLIPTVHLPPLAINDIFTVASEAAMLALTAQVGDMAIRTDNGKTYVLSAAPASTVGNWKEIMATGQVVSVNGSTGVVSITAASIGAVPTTRQVIAGTGLTGGGPLSADVTLSVAAGAGGKRYAATLPSGATHTVTHNLNTQDVLVQVYNSATPFEEIIVEVEHTTVNTITIKANPTLPAGYRVVVLG